MVQFMMLSVCQIMNEGFETLGKKPPWLTINAIMGIAEGPMLIAKNLSEDVQRPRRDLNLAPLEYNAGAWLIVVPVILLGSKCTDKLRCWL
jgi:hypothetical protein